MALDFSPSSSTTSVSSNSSNSSYSPTFAGLMWTLNGVVFLVHLTIVGIAFLNFKVILQTKVVHRNLRFVLLVQSAMIACWSGSQLNMIAQRPLLHSDSSWGFASVGSPLMISIDSFFDQYVLAIGHALLIERSLATVFVARYEHWTGWWLSAGWFIVLTAFSAMTSVATYSMVVRYGMRDLGASWWTVAYNFLLVLLCFVECFAVSYLGLWNARKYSQCRWYAERRHSLSERYQLSENVRTLRQLGAVFLAHFLEMLGTALVLLVLKILQPSDADVSVWITMLTFWNGMCNLGIVLSIIAFHPVLRSRARRVRARVWSVTRRTLCCLCCFFGRRFSPPTAGGPSANAVGDVWLELQQRTAALKEAPGTLSDGSLEEVPVAFLLMNANHPGKEGELHFRMLSQQWS